MRKKRMMLFTLTLLSIVSPSESHLLWPKTQKPLSSWAAQNPSRTKKKMVVMISLLPLSSTGSRLFTRPQGRPPSSTRRSQRERALRPWPWPIEGETDLFLIIFLGNPDGNTPSSKSAQLTTTPMWRRFTGEAPHLPRRAFCTHGAVEVHRSVDHQRSLRTAAISLETLDPPSTSTQRPHHRGVRAEPSQSRVVSFVSYREVEEGI